MDDQPSTDSSAGVRALLALFEPRGSQAGAASLSEIARQVQHLSVADATELGFSFASPSDHTGERQIYPSGPAGLPRGAFTLMISPGRGHRALLWHAYETDALRLWIDAREVALPTDPRGNSLAEPPGGWTDERFFSIEVIAADHPGQDWTRPSGRGQVRGLLVCDALEQHEWTAQPHAHETWTRPMLRVPDGRLRLYADEADLEADRPAREWLLG